MDGPLERVGPFVLVEPVVLSRAMTFVAATTLDDRRVALQLLVVPKPAQREGAAHSRVERDLRAKTLQLLDDPDLRVESHGAVETQDGTRIVFWALPEGEPVKDPVTESVLKCVACDLLERLLRRHQNRRVEPHLEAARIVEIDGHYSISAVPFIAASEQTGDPSEFVRAPFEGREPSVMGDFWRLSRVLKELQARCGAPISQALVDWIDAITPGNAHEDASFGMRALSDLRALGDAHTPIAPPTVAIFPDRDRIEAATVAWTPAMMPEGASPWSEVVPTHAVTGPPRNRDAEITPAQDEEPRGTNPQDSNSNDVIFAQRIQACLPFLARKGVARGSSARKLALALAGVLLVLGLFAWMHGSTVDPIEALSTVPLVVKDEVTLTTDTPATVISEEDGNVLGSTPITFLVPQGSNAAVLVTADGFTPIRLSLPDRGRVHVGLVPLLDEACQMDAAHVELVSTTLAGTQAGVVRFLGAAVVRSKRKDERGVRIVRCSGRDSVATPSFFAAPKTVVVRVTKPDGARVFIQGRALGMVPQSLGVDTVFVHTVVANRQGETRERWVYAPHDVVVEMAPPSAAIIAQENATQRRTSDARISVSQWPPSPLRAPDALARDRAMVLLRRGSQQLLEEKRQDAEHALTECVALDPLAAECHRLLAALYREERDGKKSAKHYEEYLSLVPDAPDAALVRRMLAAEFEP